MDIFVFSSETLTNIWAGIGANMWAVADTGKNATFRGRATKSKNMKIGSFGILYCNQTHSLTTPFIVYSGADAEKIVENIWAGKWVLPFKMFPLGTPNRQLKNVEAKRILPIFKNDRNKGFSDVFHVQAVTVFSPSQIGIDDWEILMNLLAI